MLEWADDLLDWAHDEDNQDLAEDAAEVCEDILGREEPCHYEWESFWRSASACKFLPFSFSPSVPGEEGVVN